MSHRLQFKSLHTQYCAYRGSLRTQQMLNWPLHIHTHWRALLEWSKGANGAHVVNHFCLQSRGITYSASIVHHRHDHLRIRQAKDAGPNAQALPLTTGETLHLPSTYTMLAHLLPRRDSQLSGRRIAELGAGLGLASSVLQQVEPAPSRLVVTDGDSEVLPLLCTNLEANRRTSHDGEPRKVVPECFRLLWGEPLPECDGADGSDVGEARPVTPLAAAFDLVLAADAVFSATPPKASGSRYECDAATASTVRALFATAASLLDPRASDPPARLVLTCEPRDRLGRAQRIHCAPWSPNLPKRRDFAALSGQRAAS